MPTCACCHVFFVLSLLCHFRPVIYPCPPATLCQMRKGAIKAKLANRARRYFPLSLDLTYIHQDRKMARAVSIIHTHTYVNSAANMLQMRTDNCHRIPRLAEWSVRCNQFGGKRATLACRAAVSETEEQQRFQAIASTNIHHTSCGYFFSP